MKNLKIYKISLCAMFTALVFVATYLITIPLPAVGYLNLGDTFIVLSAIILGAPFGAICGGLGAMLADILLGYGVYAPATLIIKAAMAISCYYVYKLIAKLFNRPIGFFLGALAAEIIMVIGYFLFEGIFITGFAGAALNILFNLIQGGVCLVASNIIANVLFSNSSIKKQIERLNNF